MRKVLPFIIVLILAVAAYGWFFVYNKPHKDIAKSKTDFTFLATELSLKFETEAKKTNSKLNEKVLSIEGTIHSISNQDTLCFITLKGSKNYVISSELTKDECTSLRKLKTGDRVKLKGLYVGYFEADEDFEMIGDIKLKKTTISK